MRLEYRQTSLSMRTSVQQFADLCSLTVTIHIYDFPALVHFEQMSEVVNAGGMKTISKCFKLGKLLIYSHKSGINLQNCRTV